MIAEGAEAIMSAHIALPWCDPTFDEGGNMPASLSKTLMTDLLKGELGFDGCIISDAMSMVGTAARVPVERLSVEFLRAGGDLVLFPEKEDHKRILEALKSGYLERERLVDAAERVVKLKEKLGLFDGREYKVTEDDMSTMYALLEKAAEKSSEKAPLLGIAIPRSSSPRIIRVSPGFMSKISRACFGITICPFSPTVAVHAYFPFGVVILIFPPPGSHNGMICITNHTSGLATSQQYSHTDFTNLIRRRL
jgi:beta-glucosidase-like glycosyl hydrolase